WRLEVAITLGGPHADLAGGSATCVFGQAPGPGEDALGKQTQDDRERHAQRSRDRLDVAAPGPGGLEDPVKVGDVVDARVAFLYPGHLFEAALDLPGGVSPLARPRRIRAPPDVNEDGS